MIYGMVLKFTVVSLYHLKYIKKECTFHDVTYKMVNMHFPQKEEIFIS